MPNILHVQTDDTLAFTAAIAKDAGVAYDLQLKPGPAGVNGNALDIIRSIAILSKENLAWELWIFKTAAGQNADPNLDHFAGRWAFAAADGLQIGGAGLFYYYIDGLEVPYRDLDFTGKMHMILVNRSVAAKSAGAGGQLVVKLGLQPMSQLTG